MFDTKLTEAVFPHLSGVVVDQVDAEVGILLIRARPRGTSAVCPDCAAVSAAVHSRYERQLADMPAGGQPVRIMLRVRRFFCRTKDCVRRTFVEQVEGLASRRRRCSSLLSEVLTSIGLALAGRAGARLAAGMAIATSRMTLLRLVRAIPEPQITTPRVLGVDDFALRRGHVYSTILLDMETRQPIDVLADREATTLAAWLKAHPGVEIICRDRAGAYAEGARLGAPEAIQVADRYHLWANLGEAVEKTVVTHHGCLRKPEPTPDDDDGESSAVSENAPVEPDGMRDVCGRERPLVARTRQRYDDVQGLLAQGYSLGKISRELKLDHSTVRRFARATCVEELLVKAVNRASKLDRYKPYLNQRWNEGCTDATRLHAEIQARGWRGSVQAVRRYVHPFRTTLTAPPVAPTPPKPRQVARWIMTKPDDLNAEDALRLKEILARCPELDATAGYVREFAAMMRDPRGDLLEDWMCSVEASALPALRSLVIGLRRDQAAVTAGLSLHWNSGPVEGQVNRVKMLKRTMFGRANLDLLRCRILNRH
ncbi:ISL3 family transposase [Amycolatopsis sp. NPDC059657]|uniref:ISL3 family transposase n=1 Tax=Amycolatopsis sp. NPDC059657 TaxID=3346899 RepID=UPI003670E7D3